MGKNGPKTIPGPVHGLEKMKELIRQGKVEFAGRPPDLRTEPDFTVTAVELMDSFQINWQTVSAGFGQLNFHIEADGKMHCDAENMDREFVRSVLMKLADQVVIDS